MSMVSPRIVECIIGSCLLLEETPRSWGSCWKVDSLAVVVSIKRLCSSELKSSFHWFWESISCGMVFEGALLRGSVFIHVLLLFNSVLKIEDNFQDFDHPYLNKSIISSCRSILDFLLRNKMALMWLRLCQSVHKAIQVHSFSRLRFGPRPHAKGYQFPWIYQGHQGCCEQWPMAFVSLES